MQKAYNRINWENYPSDKTPLNESNLNKIDAAMDEVDNRLITIDLTKFDKTSASGLMTAFELNTETGDITLTFYSGSKRVIPTNLAKIALNISYDAVNERLVLDMPDGSVTYVDMKALITQFEFLESDTIAFEVTADGKVKANIKPNSITGDMLQPNYLADIMVQAEITAQKAGEAASSATAAALSEQNAADSEQVVKESEEITTQKADEAANSAMAAASSEAAALQSQQASALSEQNAATSEKNAKASENTASEYASAAMQKASEALESANIAAFAESYAVGGKGLRENEDVDNSKYYYEQAKRISQGMNGLIPMGTITFADLGNPDNQVSKYMFNISDAFTTDATFKEGDGHYYGAGTNVYRTDDGYWDALAGSTVTGIKGEKETTYRQGNVNITPDDIGALATNGDSKDNTVSFTTNDMLEPAEWREMGLLTPREPHATIFTKISTAFRNLRYLYKLLGTTDISAIGDGTVSGAIHAINDKLFIKFCNGTDVNTVLETQFQSMAAKSQQSIWVRSNIKNMVGVMYRYDATGFALLSYQNETTTHAYTRNADGTWTGEALATQA